MQFVHEALQSPTVVVAHFEQLRSPATHVVGHLWRDRLQLQIAALHFTLGPEVPTVDRGLLPECELREGSHDLLAFSRGEPHIRVTKSNY